MNYVKLIMMATLVVLGLCCLLYGSDFWLTSVSEWAVMLLFVNYFAVLATTSRYYDSVHPYGKMIHQE